MINAIVVWFVKNTNICALLPEFSGQQIFEIFHYDYRNKYNLEFSILRIDRKLLICTELS